MIGEARRSLARALVASGGFFSLHLGDLPRHAESFDERRRGVDRSAVVVVAVLAVAEQDGVDTEFDDGHEDVRDDEDDRRLKIQFSQRHCSRSKNTILCIHRSDHRQTHSQQRRAIDDNNIERQRMKNVNPNSTSGHLQVNRTRHQRTKNQHKMMIKNKKNHLKNS